MLPDDRLLATPFKGRGTATRILHRFHREGRERVDDGWPADAHDADADAPAVQTQVTHEQAKTILTRNDSPDLPFTWSINPYWGCEHGCIYCYARPTHSRAIA